MSNILLIRSIKKAAESSGFRGFNCCQNSLLSVFDADISADREKTEGRAVAVIHQF